MEVIDEVVLGRDGCGGRGGLQTGSRVSMPVVVGNQGRSGA